MCEKLCRTCETDGHANLSGERKKRKRRKKGIDKGERIWYSNKAVGAGDRTGKEEKKKPLDSRKEMW